jgi:hypothetical protein
VTFNRAALVVALVAGFQIGAHAAGEETARSAKGATGLPVVAQHYYRMLAKMRPLMFWISRDNVGGARIGWLGDQHGSKGFELLIGSDPLRAPRQINRWGYIAEELRGSSASTLGVMKQSNDESIEDAKAKLGSEPASSHTFKAIRATTSNGQARADVLTLHVRNDFTYRELGSLLTLVNNHAATTDSKTVSLPSGMRPGFLLALSDLISNPKLKSVAYVYNGKFHTLHVKGVDAISTLPGRPNYGRLMRVRFETENQSTRERTPFEITYGTTGSLKEVPVHVSYQPRWWFQVELFLEDSATF